MTVSKFKIIAAALGALLALVAEAQTLSPIMKEYGARISPDSMQAHLRVLTADSLEGRETGREGQRRAARYIGEKLAGWGLQPLGREGGYQDHALSPRATQGRNLEANGASFCFYRDYYYYAGADDTTLELKQLAYLNGLGQETYGSEWTGTHILLEAVALGKKTSAEDFDRRLRVLLGQRPAVVLLVVHPFTEARERLVHAGEATRKLVRDFPATRIVWISTEVATALFPRGFEHIFRELRSDHPAGRVQERRDILPEVKLHWRSDTRALIGQNIPYLLPGTDPKGRCIVISAHYDHLGVRDSAIYYGADDNGSGTAALLELARVFALAAREGHRPKYGILFLPVSGEEKGLLGSKFYVENPLVPLRRTLADLNIDMIGRTDFRHDSTGQREYIYVIGEEKLNTRLHKLNRAVSEQYTRLALDYTYNDRADKNRYYARSDHYNFVKKGIPALFFFSGNHADYHKPSDTIDKLDLGLMGIRCRQVLGVGWGVIYK